MKRLLLATTILATVAAPALAKKMPPAPRTTVKLADAKGKPIGTAVLTPDPKDGVAIALDLHDLPPGEHAIHVHETAKCDAPDFKSAGGHFNPEHKHHGLENKEGPHAGDMPNFTVDA